jgi:hypothetical protein
MKKRGFDEVEVELSVLDLAPEDPSLARTGPLKF